MLCEQTDFFPTKLLVCRIVLFCIFSQPPF